MAVIKKNFPDHLVLGEEGGVMGDSTSDYLWVIDPVGWPHRTLCLIRNALA